MEFPFTIHLQWEYQVSANDSLTVSFDSFLVQNDTFNGKRSLADHSHRRVTIIMIPKATLYAVRLILQISNFCLHIMILVLYPFSKHISAGYHKSSILAV